VGDAVDEDNAFYGAEIWEDGNESDAASFSSEEAEPDEFESDFNDTEDEGEAAQEGDTTKKGKKMAREIELADKTAARNVYKEPTRMPRRKVPSGGDAEGGSGAGAGRLPRAVIFAYDGPIDRAVRGSTKAKTAIGEKERTIAEKERKKTYRPRPVIKHTFTQRELLADALATEESNKQWLSQQKFIMDEKIHIDRVLKGAVTGSLKRWLSKRGTNDIISFTEVDAIPRILKGLDSAPTVPNKFCTVTGKAARYRDPLTGEPYHDLAAFKVA